MWALDLDLEEFDISDNIEDGYHDLISDLVSASTPGTLTKLSTLDPRFDDFIATVEDAQVDDEKCGLTLYNDQSELDQVFSSIKILHLQGLYPQWRSPAYHGLVDLRITPTYEEPGPLSELEFITMLRASPKLRILHFGYPIINRSEGNVYDIRVVLNELEVLQITSFELGSFGVALEPHDVFRLISPGPKPLHFAMHCHPRNEDELTVDLSFEDTEAFLERAKVAKLCASRYSLPDRLFRMSSHLKVLILEEYQHTLSPSLPTN
ncbi:hypothetical protein B0J17DRAFT_151930 [Rhizoctonia solani]|nr:hypothetical protein B0J17DRAFT_151930 [Rhizoctonia solani]